LYNSGKVDGIRILWGVEYMIHTELVSLDVKRVLMQLGIRGNWSADSEVLHVEERIDDAIIDASMTNEQTFPDTELPKPYATFLSDVK
jgi:hypothetical protein